MKPRKKKRSPIGEEWLSFRILYLFSQVTLAEALGCSRRTVQYVESAREHGEAFHVPMVETQRRFKALKAKFEAEASGV